MSTPFVRSSILLLAIACAVPAPAHAHDAPSVPPASAATPESGHAAPTVVSRPQVSPADALAAIEGDSPPQVLDVRSADEFAAGRVPGAVLIPHDELGARLGELDRDRPVLVYCRSGRRSTLAETQLLEAGFDVRQIEGSWLRWTAEGRPVETNAEEAK